MRVPSLRARFALLSAVLVLLVSSLVGVVGYLTLRHSLLTRVRHTAQTEAARLAGLIGTSSDAQGDSVDITDPSLTRQLSTPGLRVEIDRPSGAVVQATPRARPARVVSLPPATRRQCLRAGSGSVESSSPPAQVACRRVGSARAPVATIAVAASLQDAFNSLDTLRRSLLIGVVGGSLLAAVLSLLVARQALRPIKRIAAAAQRIRSGDLGRRIQYRRRDELGQLAAVLDACFDELEQAIERQRRFGADASHELKTPLAAIRANVELLRGWGALDPAATDTALASLDQASRRAVHLVADMLHLAKLDREPVRIRTPVRLDEVVLEAVREAAPLRPEVPIRVARLDEAVIEGDPLGLQQLLLNLLDNALTVSPAGSEVRIELARGEGHATITVTDSGPGIAPGELLRIFDRFYSKRTGRDGHPGAGLGLAIARAIAVEHDGQLTAANAPAGGATFTAIVPLSTNRPPQQPAATGSNRAMVPAGPR